MHYYITLNDHTVNTMHSVSTCPPVATYYGLKRNNKDVLFWGTEPVKAGIIFR